jgi:ABC-type nickel/cobalt efflux system permease component RcnA
VLHGQQQQQQQQQHHHHHQQQHRGPTLSFNCLLICASCSNAYERDEFAI